MVAGPRNHEHDTAQKLFAGGQALRDDSVIAGDMLSGRLETILRGILGIPLRILLGSSHGSPTSRPTIATTF